MRGGSYEYQKPAMNLNFTQNRKKEKTNHKNCCSDICHSWKGWRGGYLASINTQTCCPLSSH